MSYTYQAGFIGAGNMGGALALAAAKSAGGEQIAVSCSTADSTAAAAERLGCAAETPARILRGSRFVFLGMKPQMLDYVMAPLAADVAGSDAIFVSMLAGVRIERLQKLLGAEKKIIRIMPNTPCAVGEGVILLCRGAGVTDGEVAEFRALMAHSGLLDEIPETQIDAASAVAGCGPAFAYLFVEALADGGVACGLPRAKALRRADAARERRHGAAERQAPRSAERRGLQPRRQYDRRCPRPRTRRVPQCLLRRGRGGVPEDYPAWVSSSKRAMPFLMGGFAALCASDGYASLRRSLRAKCFLRRTRRRKKRISIDSRLPSRELCETFVRQRECAHLRAFSLFFLIVGFFVSILPRVGGFRIMRIAQFAWRSGGEDRHEEAENA